MLNVLLFSLIFLSFQEKAANPALLTVAEKSGFKDTAKHADVMELAEKLTKSYPTIKLTSMGKSFEGRSLPLLIVADPPVSTPEEAQKSGKLVVMAMGNIHAGEVCGKEALMMLARDIAESKSPILKNTILLFAPIYNADGNEKVSLKNRIHQNGPDMGKGVRENAQHMDLNRDFVKLEAPETRALVRCFNTWDPSVIIDTHTTNGSLHRHLITYDTPRHPAANLALVEFARDIMLPQIGQKLQAASGMKIFVYGNFVKNDTQWETYPSQPRYGIQYIGLRNRIAVLSEAYAYASFKDRVYGTLAFVKTILEFSSENAPTIRTTLKNAEPKFASANNGDSKIFVPIRSELAPLPGGNQRVSGYYGATKGKLDVDAKPKEYDVEVLSLSRSTFSVAMPAGYLIPAKHIAAVQTLQRHNIQVEEIREDIDLPVESYRVDRMEKSKIAFQGHQMLSVTASLKKETKRVSAGTFLVKTAQPLGVLATTILEPSSEDGLCTWNFFDDSLEEGKDFPILRLLKQIPILTTAAAALPEDEIKDQVITYDTIYGSGPLPNFNGAPVAGVTWLPDGEHFLQYKGQDLYRVVAASGDSDLYFDSKTLSEAIEKSSKASAKAVRAILTRRDFKFTTDKKGILFELETDLHYAKIDGSMAVRLTKVAGKEDLADLSPDGNHVAFVRNHNLYVVDVATQTERQLTNDASETLFNGKADWVYFEEVYNRDWKGFWWSPDSSQIAFLKYNDKDVNKFTVVQPLTPRQNVELTAYPKSGDPNPKVTIHLAEIATGAVKDVTLPKDPGEETIVQRLVWSPTGDKLYYYISNRIQTWYDINVVAKGETTSKTLFRETTKAWVNDPGDLNFLKDGSFLFTSERDGWKHLYHYKATGELVKQVTSGEWEIHDVSLLDEEKGMLYVRGTKDSAIADNLYQVSMADGSVKRLTPDAGTHTCGLSPKGNYFVDSWSSHDTQPKLALRKIDGSVARTMDTNPVRAMRQFKREPTEFVKIKTADGFEMEGTITLPPNLDPAKKYPVWLMTYGGPHTPTITDSWGFGRGQDQVLANMGIIAFHVDPRSASNKGAVSTWTCYKQLGKQELKDLEDAVDWICKRPYVDATRVGFTGHSYGGFMTAYALTHSKKFSCGISGAPVTDWHNYDSIYTERYMSTPQLNKEGYDAQSVVKAAKDLTGKLLLLHGYIDDNVHVQNSMQFVNALQTANKEFELMIYPTSRHGIRGSHYERIKMEFIKRNLKPEAPAPAKPAATEVKA